LSFTASSNRLTGTLLSIPQSRKRFATLVSLTGLTSMFLPTSSSDVQPSKTELNMVAEAQLNTSDPTRTSPVQSANRLV